MGQYRQVNKTKKGKTGNRSEVAELKLSKIRKKCQNLKSELKNKQIEINIIKYPNKNVDVLSHPLLYI